MTLEFVVSVDGVAGTANESSNLLVSGDVVRIALTTTGTVKDATVLYADPTVPTLAPDNASDPTYWEFTPTFTDGCVYRIQVTVDQQTKILVLRGACANGLLLLAAGERADSSANRFNATESAILAASEDNYDGNPYGYLPVINQLIRAVPYSADLQRVIKVIPSPGYVTGTTPGVVGYLYIRESLSYSVRAWLGSTDAADTAELNILRESDDAVFITLNDGAGSPREQTGTSAAVTSDAWYYVTLANDVAGKDAVCSYLEIY